jgi:large subunit ribosomal protein L31e
MAKTLEDSITRVYTINLGKAWISPQYRRTNRVINMIREFARKHMKSDEIKLEQDLNRQIWSRGKTNPPRKVRVKMVKDEDGVVTVSLYEDMPEATAAATTTTATTTESAATVEEKEADITSPAAETTTAAKQSKEETKTEATSK